MWIIQSSSSKVYQKEVIIYRWMNQGYKWSTKDRCYEKGESKTINPYRNGYSIKIFFAENEKDE